jgi:hypothetical protein
MSITHQYTSHTGYEQGAFPSYTDNINFIFTVHAHDRPAKSFFFETIDLYDKASQRSIYCIHALSFLLASSASRPIKHSSG